MPSATLTSDTQPFDLVRFAPAAWRPKRRVKDKIIDLSVRYRYVVDLYLSGLPREEIEELTGYTPSTISSIVNSPQAQMHRQQIMKHYDSDFQALYSKVISTVRENLSPEAPPAVRNEAAKIWLRAHGKLEQEPTGQGQGVNFSAEKIVVQILQQAQQERAEIEFSRPNAVRSAYPPSSGQGAYPTTKKELNE